MSLLRTVITVYVVAKVAPVIIKGVVYITEGAVTGIQTKIVKDIVKVVYGEEKPRRNLRKDEYYSGRGFNSYEDYRSSCRDEA